MARGLVIRFAIAFAAACGLIAADVYRGAFDGARRQLSLVIAPLRGASRLPILAIDVVGDFFSSRAALIDERDALAARLLKAEGRLVRADFLAGENRRLRELLNARAAMDDGAEVAEVVNTASLPFAERVLLDKGARDGLAAGQGVFDLAGVVGQITRADADGSHVTLLSDARMWTATRIARTGLLAIARGSGDGKGLLDLQFLAADADLRVGDALLTDGGGGVFPPGLPVADVISVRRVPGAAFLRAQARPRARFAQNRALLVFTGGKTPPPFRDDAFTRAEAAEE
jgi:rod shape-determining protein MreC